MQSGDDGTELLLTGVDGAEFEELPECAPAEAAPGATHRGEAPRAVSR